MNPNYYIKFKGMKYPVYRSPVSEEQIKELLITSKYKKFYIHDQKTGKVKLYNFSNKLPKINNIDLSIGYNTILKMGLGVVVSYWAYKLITYRPFKDVKKPFSYKEWLADYNKKLKEEKKVKSSTSTSNGWVIEEIQ